MNHLRRPSGLVVIGGNRFAAAALEVMQSRTKDADTFWAEIPLSVIGDVKGSNLSAKVYMSNDGPAETLMFDGFVDRVNINFDTGMVTIDGRDKVKKLIDSKARKGWINQKPQELVDGMAQESGIEIDSDDLSDMSGREFNSDWHDYLTDTSKWSKICEVAGAFGLGSYATLGKIFLKKQPETDLEIYEIEYVAPTRSNMAKGNFVQLSGSKNLSGATGGSVKITSWNHEKKESIQSEAKDGEGPSRTFIMPGLTQQQADAMAQQKLHEVSSTGQTISLTVPGDVNFNVRKNVKLSGSGTTFDDTFETQSVEFRMDSGQGRGAEGFVMQISAKGKAGSGEGGLTGDTGATTTAPNLPAPAAPTTSSATSAVEVPSI